MTPWEVEEQGSLGRSASVGALSELGAFMHRVYLNMAIGLAVTGATAMAVANSPSMLETVARFFWPLIIGELVVVMGMTALAQRISAGTAFGLFLGYALLNGLTMALVFAVYTRESVASTFFVTAGTFGAMSAWGFFTKRDLTRFGSFLAMGLIGLIIASIVNIFLQSSAVTWVTTCIGVLVFVGLSAWDTQKLKRYFFASRDENDRRKLAVNGALMLYLDFVNLFLYLLRLFGRRR